MAEEVSLMSLREFPPGTRTVFFLFYLMGKIIFGLVLAGLELCLTSLVYIIHLIVCVYII